MPTYEPFDPTLREQMMELAKMLVEDIMPRFKYLFDLEYRTEEEELEMNELNKLVEYTLPTLERFKDMLGQHLFAFSQEVYLDAKIKAERGDEELKKFYEELRPAYEAMMLEQMNKRIN